MNTYKRVKKQHFCLDCGAVKSDKGKYCKKCGYSHRTRPSGLKYVLHKENPTSFKKGDRAWNKGLRGVMKAWNKGIKGLHLSPNTEFKDGDNANEKNCKWKGELVGYQNLHVWLKRHLSKKSECILCGKEGKTHWANVSHKYLRSFSDFVELCPKCHSMYDHGLISLITKDV